MVPAQCQHPGLLQGLLLWQGAPGVESSGVEWSWGGGGGAAGRQAPLSANSSTEQLCLELRQQGAVGGCPGAGRGFLSHCVHHAPRHPGCATLLLLQVEVLPGNTAVVGGIPVGCKGTTPSGRWAERARVTV